MNKPSSFLWRPTTTVILLSGFLLILVAIVASFVASNFKPTVGVQLGSGMYSLWLADTEQEREQGLSGVENLRVNEGLLMAYDYDQLWGIWMKDMKIPLDIVWLDSTKKVVHIEERVSHELSTDKILVPKKPSRYVVELASGSVKKAGIRIGQTAQFKIEGAQ